MFMRTQNARQARRPRAESASYDSADRYRQRRPTTGKDLGVR
jgi:hypothetical protein